MSHHREEAGQATRTGRDAGLGDLNADVTTVDATDEHSGLPADMGGITPAERAA